jgi:hypothetical protein
MWAANLLVSGSAKFNDVTRELHSSSTFPLQLCFPREGGAIVDKKHERTYLSERHDGEIAADYGVLGKYKNPYDDTNTIVLVAGIESVFQLGITQTLQDRRAASRFLREVKQHFGGSLPHYFEVLVKAPGRGLEFTGPLEVIEAYRLND